MANTLAPSGFKVVRRYDGTAANYAVITKFIAYNNTNQIARGDPVKFISTGYIDLMAVGGTTIDGIFLGCEYFDPNHTSETPFRPAWLAPTLASGTIVRAKVMVDPMVVLQCQLNGGPALQADIGNNIDIKSGTSGQPAASSGISTCALDYSTRATTATLPFRIIGIVGGPSLQIGGPAISAAYDPTQANNWVEVVMNTADITQTTGI